MTATSNIAGILFDLDNTLIATEQICGELLSNTLAAHNVALSSAEQEWMVGRSWKDIANHLIEPRNLPVSSEEILNRLLDEKDKIITKTRPFLPGAETSVRLLSQQFPIGIVSGSFRSEITTIIDLMNIAELIQVIIGAEDVSNGKPHPEPYLTGSRKLGLQPETVLVFEDSVSGVTSAKRAGCYCIAVKACALPDCDLSKADKIIDTLECVNPEFIAGLVKR